MTNLSLQQIPTPLAERQAQLDEQDDRLLLFNGKTFLKSFFIQKGSKLQHTVLHRSIGVCLNAL